MKILLAALGCFLLIPPAGAQSSDVEELERRAQEHYELGELESAAGLYRRIAELRTGTAKAQSLLYVAQIEQAMGHEIEAVETVTRALVLAQELAAEPQYGPFRRTFAKGWERAQILLEQRAYAEVREGLGSLREGRLESARGHFETALDARPHYVEALYNLALVDLREERLEDAQAGFEKILSLAATPTVEISDDLHGRCLAHVGRIYSQRGLDDEAAEAFARAAELRPDDPTLAEQLAQALLDAERWDDAVRHLEAARLRHGREARLAFQLALAHTGRGDTAAAVAAFEAVLGLDADDRHGLASVAALRLARHFQSAGETERSLAMADRVLGWRRDQVDGWIFRGLALVELGRLDEARQALEEARRLAPERAGIHNHLGFIFLQLGRLDEAEAALHRALELDPELAAARANLETVESLRAQPPTSKRRKKS